VQAFVKPFMGKGAWRVDKEEGANDEYVPVCGWPSVERHKSFAQEVDFPKYAELFEYIVGADVQHYQRVL